ncbi:MAG TPA: DUF1553 domain-containing protein, partial [Planctomycetota bacterium]|nr:DUF1553 domain-containing protein [Planctomycetota bacterium]
DHKFDPVGQAEHYALQACLSGVDRADRPYDADPAQNRRRQQLLRQKRTLAARTPLALQALADPGLQQEIATWEQDEADQAGKWTELAATSAVSKAGATLEPQPDHSILSTGARPETDTYTITAPAELANITAVRLEVLTCDGKTEKGPGRQENGNLHLSEFRVLDGERTLPIQKAIADFEQDGWTIAHAIDGNPATAWGIYPETGKPHVAVFELAEPVSTAQLTFVLEQLHGGHHLIARPRLSVTSSPPPFNLQSLPGDITAILRTPANARNDGQQQALAAWFLARKLDRALAALPPPLLVYSAASDFPPNKQFLPARVPRPVFVLARGDVTKPGAPAVPGALACVPGLEPVFTLADADDEGARRAALARWITDPRNVLTWRSISNRIWQHHFGRGIVDSPNDFGRMGALPTHNELLDWLAVDFRDHGGAIKRLHKLILMSACWQQSSRHDPVAAEKDAGNLQLWRMNRIRLDAEQVRDAILAISGKLDLKMGGPPVKQFAYDDPNPDVTPKVDYKTFDPDHPDNHRRSIYRFLFRTLPDPFMDVLDCADGSQLTPVRNVSITALQAMVLMNDRFVVRQSEHLAARIAGRGDTAAQIEALYRLTLQRQPTADEARLLADYASKHGMANACRMLLNSSECNFVD